MIGFLLPTPLPPSGPPVHPCPSLVIGCAYDSPVSHHPPALVLFADPCIVPPAVDFWGSTSMCAQMHTTPPLVLVVAIILVQFVFSLSQPHTSHHLSLSAPLLIANSQIYLVRSGHLIRSPCHLCVPLPRLNFW